MPALSGNKEIIEPVGSGILGEGGNPEESFRYKVYPLYEDLRLQVIP